MDNDMMDKVRHIMERTWIYTEDMMMDLEIGGDLRDTLVVVG